MKEVRRREVHHGYPQSHSTEPAQTKPIAPPFGPNNVQSGRAQGSGSSYRPRNPSTLVKS